MNAEFNVWLLIVGLVVGAGLVWLVMLDGRRRESDIDAQELPREAAWLSAVLAEDGFDVSPEAAEQLLLLHRTYLGAPPPDPVVEEPVVEEPALEAAIDGLPAQPDDERAAPEDEPPTPGDERRTTASGEMQEAPSWAQPFAEAAERPPSRTDRDAPEDARTRR